jgi:hypothetical protein
MRILLFLLFSFSIYSGEFDFNSKDDFKKLNRSGVKISLESVKSYKLELAKKKIEYEKELYLDFENKKASELKDKTGNYTILNSNYSVVSEKTNFSKKHASFANSDSMIKISATNGRLLESSHFKEPFYISFYVKPGESVQYSNIFYKKYYSDGKKIGLECRIVNNRLEISFSNMYSLTNSITKTFQLLSEDKLQNEKWTHVLIVVDPHQGTASLFEDGKPKSEFTAIYSESNPTPLPIGFHKHDTTPLIIGKDFYGKLDEFIIGRGNPDINSLVEPYHSVAYDDSTKFGSQTKGYAYSEVLKTKYSFSKLVSVQPELHIPTGTNLEIHFRISNEIFDKNTDQMKWFSLEQLNDFKETPFQYLQWRAVLRSDSEGQKTPSLSRLKIKYLESFPPSPPSGLKAKLEGNDKVCLTWTSNHEDNVRKNGSYLIHYGLSPDRMVGTIYVNERGEKITGLNPEETLEKNYRNLRQCVDNQLITQNALLRKDKNMLQFRSGMTYYFKISAVNSNYNSETGRDQKSKPSNSVIINFNFDLD